MNSEIKSSAMYERLRSTFSALKPTSKEEFLELVSSIFAGDDFWTNRDEHYYVEYHFEDSLKPLKCFVEQKPAVSIATFMMTKADLEDQELMQYAEHRLAQSRSHILTVNYVMTWFFLKSFSLLPRCRHDSSREKVLDFYHAPESDQSLTFPSLSPLFESDYREDFDESPLVICGELRPSDLLRRGQGFSSVVVFPYDCIEWDDEFESCIVTAYLVEFPKPIEPVPTFEEASVPDSVNWKRSLPSA